MLPSDIEFILQICLPGGSQMKTALLDNSYVMVSNLPLALSEAALDENCHPVPAMRLKR